MSTDLYVAIDGVLVSPYVQEVAPTPTGPGLQGQCPLTILKAGGGLVINPLARVQVAGWSGGVFGDRLFQGVVTQRQTTRIIGTNLKIWTLGCVDCNLLDRRIGTGRAFSVTLAAAHFPARITALVAAVQGAWGGSWEGIDATSSVPDLYPAGTLPAVTYEGGHKLGWYLDQEEALVRQATSGAVDPARYYDVDPTAGASLFGGVVLRYYDANLPGLSVATYSDHPGGGIRREYSYTVDAGSYYGRREALYTGGGYASTTAAAPLVNPWSGGGWMEEPMTVETTSGAVALAALRADLAQKGALLPTLVFPVGRLHAAGDTVTVTLDEEAITGELWRVAEPQITYPTRNLDKPETTITLGVSPRRLGGGVAGRPVTLRDTVPPLPPVAAPTLVSNVYDGATHTVLMGFRTVCSPSSDVGAQQLRYQINGGLHALAGWLTAPGPDPLTLDFPPITVPVLATVVVDVQGRDTTGNEGGFGPAGTFTAADRAYPLPPTGLSVTAGLARGGRLAVAKVMYSLPVPNTADQFQMEHFVDGGDHTPDGTVPATQTTFVSQATLLPNTYYTFWIRGITLHGDYGVWATIRVLIVPLAPGPSPPPTGDYHPDVTDQLGVVGWTSDIGGGAVIAIDTTNVLTGVQGIALSVAS